MGSCIRNLSSGIITLGCCISAHCYGKEIAQVGEAWNLASKNSRNSSFRPASALEGFKGPGISTWIGRYSVGGNIRNSDAILHAP